MTVDFLRANVLIASLLVIAAWLVYAWVCRTHWLYAVPPLSVALNAFGFRLTAYNRWLAPPELNVWGNVFQLHVLILLLALSVILLAENRWKNR